MRTIIFNTQILNGRPEYKSLIESIIKHIVLINHYAEEVNFIDHDPYARYNSIVEMALRRRIPPTLLLRIFLIFDRLFPWNIRRYFLINKKIFHPKSAILFSLGYLNLGDLNKARYCLRLLQKSEFFFLRGNYAFVGAPFRHYYSLKPIMFYEKGSPNTLLTALMGKAFLKLYERSKKIEDLRMAELLANFFTIRNTYVKFNNEIVWKYFVSSNSLLIHNANIAAASFLMSLSKYKVRNSAQYLKLAKKALNHSIRQQLPNGAMPYFSKSDPNYGDVDFVDNFHNGFVILDLIDCLFSDPVKNENLKINILKALKFQLSMFNKDFSPRRSTATTIPQDIHDLSVGILVFTRASYIWPSMLNVAKEILSYTFRNFTNKDGLFVYQIILKGLKDGATYLRWNQAWMFLALTEFLNRLNSMVSN